MKVSITSKIFGNLVGKNEAVEIAVTSSPAIEPKADLEVKPEKSEIKISTSSLEIKTKPAEVLPSEDLIAKELVQGSKLSVIRLLDAIIETANNLKASDAHLDPAGKFLHVRFRVDGVLQEAVALPKELHAELISRIKILSGLRTDEHQAAQDGRFRIQTQSGQPIDVRVAIVPTYYGENAVLRLLSDNAEEFSLKSLGFSAINQQKIINAIRKPYGMVLATGPTGSGKTTTLYTLIKMLNTKEVSIITIEDPIEYSIEGINQIQVNARTQLTFANGLRSILRQDPNIIMVGEIRDAETAGIAVNTALTGHLLLSTLHTNDSATTLPRLLDMHIEPYLIASTVNIAIGQRLVRKICSSCKKAKDLSPSEFKSLTDVLPLNLVGKHQTFFKGMGCEACGNTGYSGRVGVHEVLVIDPTIREALLRKATASEIKTLAVQQGMVPMLVDGIEKAKLGITTLEEVLRMLYE